MSKHTRVEEIDDTEDRMGSVHELDLSDRRDEREGEDAGEKKLRLVHGACLLRDAAACQGAHGCVPTSLRSKGVHSIAFSKVRRRSS